MSPSAHRRQGPPPEKRPWAPGWRLVPLVGVTALVVYLLIRQLGGAGVLVRPARDFNVAPALAVLALLGLAVTMAVIRWRSVLEAMGHPLPVRRALWAIVATWPLSIVTPSRANDLFRAHAIRAHVPPLATTSSVLAERAIDIQSLCLLAMAGSLAAGQHRLTVLAALTLVAEWGIIIALRQGGRQMLRHDRLTRWRDRTDQLWTAFDALWSRPGHLIRVNLASVGVWTANVCILYALTLAFGARVELIDALALWPVALFVGLVPVTLAGLGTRDAAFLFLLGASGTPGFDRAAVLAATLGYAATTTWLLALVGLPFMVGWLMDKQAAGEPTRH